MPSQEDQDATPADREESEITGHGSTWLGWMTLFGTLGVLAAIGVQAFVAHWCQRDEVRQSRAWMADQLGQLRRGEIDCLVNPDPRFIDELLADAACAAKVRELYVGGDLSDPRLGQLRKLPHLSRIVFLFAQQHSELLERLHGMAAIEKLTFDHTVLTSADVYQIGSFPHLKSLSFAKYELRSGDLQGLRRHPSLEQLVLARATADPDLIPLLQTMPQLRHVAIGICDKGKLGLEDFEKSLRKALPRCECRAWDDER